MKVSDKIEAGFTPQIDQYDVIAVSSSGGKDSQAMLDYVHELAREAGVEDRLVVIHADLGRVEWKGTGELAKEQAKAYGSRFIITSRLGGVAKKDSSVYKKGEIYGDIIDYAERRGAWPSSSARWCTSEFKRGPIQKVYTMLAKEWRESNPDAGRPCRILDCQGLRSEESPARAKKEQFKKRKASGTQEIDTWLPIQYWLEGDVWIRIKESGVRHHPAYDLGMPRLSCAFCIFAPKKALILSGRHNKELLEEYVRVEKKINHTFRQDVSLEEVLEAVESEEGAEVVVDGAWNM